MIWACSMVIPFWFNIHVVVERIWGRKTQFKILTKVRVIYQKLEEKMECFGFFKGRMWLNGIALLKICYFRLHILD